MLRFVSKMARPFMRALCACRRLSLRVVGVGYAARDGRIARREGLLTVRDGLLAVREHRLAAKKRRYAGEARQYDLLYRSSYQVACLPR